MKDIIKKVEKELTVGSNVMSEKEFRATMIAISNVAADIVTKTLGPYGASTVIDNGTGTLYSTKDGLHTLENLRFGDPVYNALFRLLIQPSFKSSHTVGDGTTTATVVLNEFVSQVVSYLEELHDDPDAPKINQRDVLNAIKYVSDEIVEYINYSDDMMQINKDGNMNDIYNVALTSSNGDERLSSAICEIYLQTHNPDIYIDMNHRSGESYSIINGYRFDCNPFNLLEMRNSDDGSFKRSETKSLCYFFDHNLTYQEHKVILEGISSYALSKNSMAIIFAPSIDSILCDIIGSTIQSIRSQNKMPYIMLVQIPYATRLHKSVLQDLRHIANTQIFDYARVKCYRNLIAAEKGEKNDDKLEDSLYGIDGYAYKNVLEILDECSGIVRNISIYKNFAVIQDYDEIAKTEYFKNYVDEIRNEFNSIKEKNSNYEVELSKDYLEAQMHYIRLSGAMGTIYVEGESIQERRMRYDTAEDVVFACKSAYLNGVIHGTCFTTIHELAKLYNKLKMRLIEMDSDFISSNSTERVEIDLRTNITHMLLNAFMCTANKIFINKFSEGIVMGNKIKFEDIEVHDDEEDLREFINKVKSGSADLSIDTNEVIYLCSKYGFTFDLRTNTMIGKNHTVLNPINNDIEIIKSIYSMIMAILTSKQMISINRQYDKMKNRINVDEERKKSIEDDYRIKADAVITAIMNKFTKH